MRATSSAVKVAIVAGVALCATSGCPTPAQEGGLHHVDTVGFANRLRMLCRSGHADPSCPSPADAGETDDSTEGEGGSSAESGEDD